MPDQHTQPTPPQTREPTLLLADLTSELLWVRLLRAPALALSPARMTTGIITAFLLTVLAWLPSLWIEPASRSSMLSPNANPTLNPIDAFDGMIRLLARLFGSAIDHPWTALIIGVPVILILAIFGCIISRSAAIEFAQGRIAEQSETTSFVLRRISQIATAALGPLIVAIVLIGFIALGGFLISAPFVDLLGGVLYAIGLMLGLAVMLILALQLLAFPLIIPSIACEGTDGFDAVQRSYAYITGRPLRAISYALIIFVLGSLSFGVFQFVMNGSIALTDWAISLLANDAGVRVLSGEGELAATQPASHNLIMFWRSLFQLVFAGYVLSYFYTSTTMVYLLVRRVCDGQDVGEIWTDPID